MTVGEELPMARDIKALESSMRKLQENCSELASHKYFDEFFQIIHRPGWTTVLDEFFVGAMIGNLQDQVQNLEKQLETLMEGARQVGR
jgi:hypothetical protein